MAFITSKKMSDSSLALANAQSIIKFPLLSQQYYFTASLFELRSKQSSYFNNTFDCLKSLLIGAGEGESLPCFSLLSLLVEDNSIVMWNYSLKFLK